MTFTKNNIIRFEKRQKLMEEKLCQEYAQYDSQIFPMIVFSDIDFLYVQEKSQDIYGEIWRYSKNSPNSKLLVLDLNQLESMLPNFYLYSIRAAPGGQFIALAVGTSGLEVYHLWLKNINTGRFYLLSESASGDIEWDTSGTVLFYISNQDESHQVLETYCTHRMESKIISQSNSLSSSILLLSKSYDDKYIFLNYLAADSSETHIFDSETCSNLGVFQNSQEGIRYWIDHSFMGFVQLIMKDTSQIRIYSEDKMLIDTVYTPKNMDILAMEVYTDNLLLVTRGNGPIPKLLLYSSTTQILSEVMCLQPICDWSLGIGRSQNTGEILISGSSPAFPTSIFKVDPIIGQAEAISPLEMYKGFDSNDYKVSVIFATSFDKVLIPITLIHHNTTLLNPQTPFYIHVYGSYGSSYPLNFRAAAVPFLEAGGVLAYAHVRGGGELGETWHEEGRGKKKHFAVLDLKACVEYLKNAKLTSAEKIILHGTSAGGWIVTAYLNINPLPCRAIILKQPFVDSLTTLLNPTSRTFLESEEWGSSDKQSDIDWNYLWSPLQNIRPQSYPNALVFSGLNDEKVDPYSIKEWCHTIQTLANNNPHIVLVENSKTGHVGPTHPDAERQEMAREYAFVINHLFEELP